MVAKYPHEELLNVEFDVPSYEQKTLDITEELGKSVAP